MSLARQVALLVKDKGTKKHFILNQVIRVSRAFEVHLELFSSFRGQVHKVDSAAEEDVGRFGNSVDLPAQVLEKCGQPVGRKN